MIPNMVHLLPPILLVLLLSCLSNLSYSQEQEQQRVPFIFPYVLPIAVKSEKDDSFGIVEIHVDPTDISQTLESLEVLTSSEISRHILGDSLSARLPGNFRPDACDGSSLWSTLPHRATNSFDVAVNWDTARAWIGDSPRLRTVTNLWDLARLANDMDLSEGLWVELGVLKGKFSEILMEIGQATRLVMVDLWDEVDIYSAAKGKDNLELTKQTMSQFDQSNFELWKMSTLEAAALVPDGSVSFVYIDASHSYAAVMDDIEAWWPKLKVG